MKSISSVNEFKEVMMDKCVVMISKSGCAFCERAKPWLEDESQKHPGLPIFLANKDDIAPILEVFQVKMYPTFVALEGGKVLDIFYGDTAEEKVRKFIERHK